MTDLMSRVKNILISPATEWPVIEKEAGTIGDVYAKYVVFLAAIPAVCSLIGSTLFGFSFLGVSMKIPFASALASSVVIFLLSLAMIYVLALIANALAPTFGGQKNQFNAFKLVAYAYTASMAAGIFLLFPALSMLSVIAGLYSLYLLYTGLPVMMKNPQDKTLPYFLVLFICGVVASIVLGLLSACLTPAPKVGDVGDFKINTPMGKVEMSGKAGDKEAGKMTIKAGGAEIKIDAKGENDGKVTINAPGANIELDAKKMEEFAKKMEEAGKKMEAAGKGGDPTEVLKALQDALKTQPAPAK
jgi:hypothetical protein